MSEVDSPGSALRAARQAMGASVREVARSLKVSWAIIENIEAERFDALPVRVFTRAYIGSYADLLGLDADEMLRAYDQKTASGETTENETRPVSNVARTLATFTRGPQVRRRQSWVFAGTVIAIMAMSGLFLWFIWPAEVPIASAPVGEPNQISMGDGVQSVSAADEVSSESAVRADASESVSNDPVEPVPNGPIAQSETPVSGGVSGAVSSGSPNGSPDEPADDLPSSVSVLNGSPNGAEDGSVPLSNPLTYVPGGDHVLMFHFTHDSWVQVFDASGGMLHGDVERAAGELEVRGDAPFTITLGYAPGVQLEYNGEPVVLAQHTHDNSIAKLVIGL